MTIEENRSHWRETAALARIGQLEGQLAEALAALKNIAAHDPATCHGITPRDCLDVVREIARAAILKAEGRTT